jgi:hypothetical protein
VERRVERFCIAVRIAEIVGKIIQKETECDRQREGEDE